MDNIKVIIIAVTVFFSVHAKGSGTMVDPWESVTFQTQTGFIVHAALKDNKFSLLKIERHGRKLDICKLLTKDIYYPELSNIEIIMSYGYDQDEEARRELFILKLYAQTSLKGEMYEIWLHIHEGTINERTVWKKSKTQQELISSIECES